MNDKTQQRLLANDHPSACEGPPGFDRSSAMRRVKAPVPALEQIVGHELSVDESVQDASHFTDIACYHSDVAKGIGAVQVPIIRIVFSSFGDLFTVLFAEDLDQATVDEVISVVSKASFTFVPADELDEPYTGHNAHLTGMTWFTRFFCYL